MASNSELPYHLAHLQHPQAAAASLVLPADLSGEGQACIAAADDAASYWSHPIARALICGTNDDQSPFYLLRNSPLLEPICAAAWLILIYRWSDSVSDSMESTFTMRLDTLYRRVTLLRMQVPPRPPCTIHRERERLAHRITQIFVWHSMASTGMGTS